MKHPVRVSVAGFALAALSMTPTGCGKKEAAAEAKPAEAAAAAAAAPAPAAGEAKPAEAAAPAAPAVPPEQTIAEQSKKLTEAKTGDEAIAALEAAFSAANNLTPDQNGKIPDGDPLKQLDGMLSTLQTSAPGAADEAAKAAFKTRYGETLGKIIDTHKGHVAQLIISGYKDLVPATPERMANYEKMAKDPVNLVAQAGFKARFGYSIDNVKPEEYGKVFEVIAGMTSGDAQDIIFQNWVQGMKPETAGLPDFLVNLGTNKMAGKPARTKAIRMLCLTVKAKPQIEKLKATLANDAEGAMGVWNPEERKGLEDWVAEGLK